MARSIAKDHDSKRTAILTAAAQLFAEQGYDRASMADLAKACGLSKAAVYHYHSSKEGLLYDILHSHLSDLLDVVAEAVGDGPKSLTSLCVTILDAYRGADHAHRLQFSAMAALSDAQQATLGQLQREIVALVEGVIQARQPVFFADHPERLRPTSMSLFAMLNWFYLWHRPAHMLPREDYAQMVSGFIEAGIDQGATHLLPTSPFPTTEQE